MGSDAVELIMTVEETFGIGFSDAEVSGVITLGDLVDLDMLKMETRNDLSGEAVRVRIYQDVRYFFGVESSKGEDRFVEDFRLEEVLGFCSGPRSKETTI